MANLSQQMAQEQLKEITSNTVTTKQARPVDVNKQAAVSYNAELQKLVKAVKGDIDNDIVSVLRSLEHQYTGDSIVNDSWVDIIIAAFEKIAAKWTSFGFLEAAKQSSKKFIKAIDDRNRNKYAQSIKVVGVTGLDVFGDSPALQDILSSSIAENVQLIKTIPTQYLSQVQTIVMTNMRSGLRPSSIVKQLSTQYGVSQRRAAVIARDQTSKANGMLSKQRQEDTGFEYFKWVDSDDVSVRRTHEKIANDDIGYGKGVYKWSEPPKNDKGEQIIPGSEINCRCISAPVTSKQVKENKQKAKK
ncbi:MAG: phage minor head protein [Thiohalomonadales bacterium]